MHPYNVARLLLGTTQTSDSDDAPLPLLSELHETADARRWLEANLINASRAYAMRRNVYDQLFKTAGVRPGGGGATSTPAA